MHIARLPSGKEGGEVLVVINESGQSAALGCVLGDDDANAGWGVYCSDSAELGMICVCNGGDGE